MSGYDNDNVFAKILRGELPCTKIYEDDFTLAFMDIMPRTEGHCLVIPKSPSRNLIDIAQPDLCHLMGTVQKIMGAVKTALDADGITVQQFNEAAAGQVVYHTHMHILPRFDGIPLGPHTGEMADPDDLQKVARRIMAAL